MIYVVLLIFILIPIIYKKSRTNFYYVVECAVFILIAGLRNKVGGDTLGYMMDWESIPLINNLNTSFFLYSRYQPLWIILSSICKTIYSEFVFFQLVHAFIINVCLFWIFNKEVREYRFHIVLLYYLFSYLYFNMEILRESLAICFVLFSLKYYVHRDWFKYYILIFIAFMFHPSCFYFYILPVFYNFLLKGKFDNKTFLIFILISILISIPSVQRIFFIFLPDEWALSFFENYASWERATILGSIRDLISVFLLFIMTKLTIQQCNISNTYKVGIKLYLLLRTIGFMLPIFSGRMANYLNVYYLLCVILFLQLNYRKIRLYKILLCMLLFISFYRKYFNDVSHYVGNTSQTYYYYELYVPYNTVFENVTYYDEYRRRLIYYQENLK